MFDFYYFVTIVIIIICLLFLLGHLPFLLSSYITLFVDK